MNTIKRIALLITVSLVTASVSAHNGHGDELPWEACSQAQKGDRCEFTNSHNDLYQGSCRVFSDALMCVRNKPIIHLGDKPKEAVKQTTGIKYTTTVDNTNQS